MYGVILYVTLFYENKLKNLYAYEKLPWIT
jgi:hypothetical protein